MTSDQMPTVLNSIVTARRGHLAAIKERLSGVDVDALTPSTRSLYDSLKYSATGTNGRGNKRFILECKSQSPSLGMIREHYQPGMIARIYSRYAAGISVLCEPERFGGDYDHLAIVASSTHLPVLCKDFIIDEVQVNAARYFGADAILLMLSVLSDDEYRTLQARAEQLGLDILTEVVDEEEVERARNLGAKIIGINHRDLHDLSIDLDRSARLAPLCPAESIVIAESGIRNHHTVDALAAPVNGFLVGSQLTSQPDIDRACRELIYGTNKVCGLRTPTAASAARAAGAVYGGLIFEPASPRAVTREQAAAIIGTEPDLEYVAVARKADNWGELIQEGITTVQVHAPLGDAAAERALIQQVRHDLSNHPEVKVWRAISMTSPGAADIATLLVEENLVDGLVLDSGQGGSGQAFDWSTIPDTVKKHSLLAGGLNQDNIDEALAQGCAGLDLNSGMEYASTGEEFAHYKDPARITAAFQKIRFYLP